ncbi:MAG: SoxR reducing system RseC family protein [Mariprofundaceae bacterium]|nr:SoxR reducing system RseC family protein [Mariprofundaceae bacterium]
MEQAVWVVDVQAGEALVRGRRATACGNCAGKSACGTLGSWVERFAEMRVANPLGAKVGDEVIVEVSDGEFLRAALRLYGAPMLGFFTFGFSVRAIAMAMQVGDPELLAAGGALTGMFGVFFWLRRSHQNVKSDARIVRICTKSIDIPVRAA